MADILTAVLLKMVAVKAYVIMFVVLVLALTTGVGN